MTPLVLMVSQSADLHRGHLLTVTGDCSCLILVCFCEKNSNNEADNENQIS